MSLLTACGELRCPATLSSRGKRDGEKGRKIEEVYQLEKRKTGHNPGG